MHVVIPFLSRGFYNWRPSSSASPTVVIPFLSRGFYNLKRML